MSKSKANQAKYDAGVGRIADQCIAVRLRMLNRVISGVYDDAVRPLGVTVGQLNILVIVERLEHPNQGEVARALHMEKSTLSRNLERLRQNQWLTVGDSVKGSGRHLSVTAKGRNLILQSLPLWEAAQERAREIIGSDYEPGLRAAVDRLWHTEPLQ